MTAQQEPLGYAVAISREAGLSFPSFPDVYDSLEEAVAEIDRIMSMFRVAEGSRFVVVALHDLPEPEL